MPLTIVFVHGWSVTNLNTYGEFPLRLRNEAAKNGIDLQVEEIFLGRYISFHDEVRLTDISRAFKTAVQEQLSTSLKKGSRFICITHSTGGPALRDWWSRYYNGKTEICPMSHLIMLAPANFGSALAKLGKGKLSRLISWLEDAEPGQGVLDWLSLGSRESFELNVNWIQNGEKAIGTNGIFPFVITGQDIDRKFYDHLNTYTGETGSDGVVRVASANLQGRYIKLVQPKPFKNAKGQLDSSDFEEKEFSEAVKIPLRVVTKKSHSGDQMGIMKSVKADAIEDSSSETLKAILDCVKVQSMEQYTNLCVQFDMETKAVQEQSRLESENNIFTSQRYFIHDRYSMVIFRVCDSEGFPVTDYDLILTAGKNNDPDHLPEGFFADRQRNDKNPEVIAFYFNYDVMNGMALLKDASGEEVRPALPGAEMLGFVIRPRPDSGFVQYVSCGIKANKDLLEKAIQPNSTTLIDVCLYRAVDKEVFRLEKLMGNLMPSKEAGDFSKKKPGGEIVD